MKTRIKTYLIAAILIGLAELSFGQSNTVNINGVIYVPWTSNDTAIVQNQIAAVEAATNGMSFTNTSVYIASGYANDSINGQNSYFSADWRFVNNPVVSAEIGGDLEMNTVGTGLHQADLRLGLVKDVSNFQVAGYGMFGRQFDNVPDWFVGIGAGVRYNLTAGLANTSNEFLNFIAGMGKVDTFAGTRIDLYSPFSSISWSALTVEKTWRFEVGVAF